MSRNDAAQITPPPGSSAAASGARRGADFIARLRSHPRALSHRGEQVSDVIAHPAFRGIVATTAKLYDLQWTDSDVSLFESPTSGRLVGRSFTMQRTRSELASVTAAMKRWEQGTHGMMGRVPSHLNRAVMGLAAAAGFLGEAEPRFGENVTARFEHLRENDLCLTATFIGPQINRARFSDGQEDPLVAAHVVRETDAGLVIRGARMLATLPIADELLVYSSAPHRDEKRHAPYAFIFSIPTHTEGLQFICRESMDYGRSGYDHPLGSRFEEMDAAVMFHDVLVPWENVFAHRDFRACNGAFHRSGALAHMDHQTLLKNVVKTEFLIGLASLLVNSIGAEVYQHIYGKLSEMWLNLETMRACLRASEADAELDEWGIMRPAADPLVAGCTLFSQTYARMIQIIQEIGASGLVAMPTAADVQGPLAEDIKSCFQSKRAEAFDRIPLFRLAWDVSMSAFGTRQVQYERYSRGDPVRVANAIIVTRRAQLERCAERVMEFVKRGQEEAYADASSGSDPT